jgi:hypothetical protein
MFFPDPDHGIEPNYIKPVLISGRGNRRLSLAADGEAFCCSIEAQELKQLGHLGALKWIRSFENKKNTTGQLLTESLKRPQHLWYEMKPDSTADFAIAMNPEDRVFTARLDSRSFVNQRLIRISAAEHDANLDLLHALLNSSLSIFFIESSGFGRGLGALDITPTKLKAGMKIVNPSHISPADIAKIVAAFQPLLLREALPLDQEMLSADRAVLDSAVLGSVHMAHLGHKIRASVTELYRVRKAVKA